MFTNHFLRVSLIARFYSIRFCSSVGTSFHEQSTAQSRPTRNASNVEAQPTVVPGATHKETFEDTDEADVSHVISSLVEDLQRFEEHQKLHQKSKEVNIPMPSTSASAPALDAAQSGSESAFTTLPTPAAEELGPGCFRLGVLVNSST
jgi:hypothetical protein